MSSASRRMPPGCTVSTSVVHASVASSIAAWMRESPSRTRIAVPSAGVVRGPQVPAQVRVPLERGHRRAHPPLTLADLVVDPAQQPGHDLLRGGRHEPVHVVRVGVQQGEFQQAGHRFGVRARHSSPAHGTGVHPVPGLAQPVRTVRMLLRPAPGHRPFHPRCAATSAAQLCGAPNRVRNTARSTAVSESPALSGFRHRSALRVVTRRRWWRGRRPGIEGAAPARVPAAPGPVPAGVPAPPPGPRAEAGPGRAVYLRPIAAQAALYLAVQISSTL